jgi:hypothetical protein
MEPLSSRCLVFGVAAYEKALNKETSAAVAKMAGVD